MPRLPRRQMAQPFGQRLLAPVTRRPSCRLHNPPRPFPTFHQTARIQQQPRRRITRRPNVPPALPQQVKQGQLMRYLPPQTSSIPAAMAPSQSLTRCAGCCAPNCQARPITPDQEPKAPNAIPPAARITFNSVRPLRVRVHKPSSSSVPSGGNRGAVKDTFPQPLADRTLDAAHPVPGAGVAQSLRGQTDGDVTVFLENRWWRISSPSSVMPPAIRRHCPQRNTGIWRRTSP